MDKYTYSTNPFHPHNRFIEWIGSGSSVLDVGCASGFIGKKLKEKGCYVIGIEKNPVSAKEAERYYDDVIIEDIERLGGIDYPEGHFDFILFGDILEHLVKPQAVIGLLSPYCKENGNMIISVPNIAHIYSRILLLMGKWDYKELGIFDETHVRFYTIKTAKTLVEGSGFTIEAIDFFPWIPYFKLRKFAFGKQLEYHIGSMLPELLALQIIIRARKK